MKPIRYFKRLVSRGICTYDGVILELANGVRIKTSPVVAYKGCSHMEIETRHTIYRQL